MGAETCCRGFAFAVQMYPRLVMLRTTSGGFHVSQCNKNKHDRCGARALCSAPWCGSRNPTQAGSDWGTVRHLLRQSPHGSCPPTLNSEGQPGAFDSAHEHIHLSMWLGAGNACWNWHPVLLPWLTALQSEVMVWLEASELPRLQNNSCGDSESDVCV